MLKTKNKFYRGKLTCKYCGFSFEHLGSHLWHKHGILARQYKEEFGLPYKEALISEDIYWKKKKEFEEHKEKYLKNIYEGGKPHQLKKGHAGTRRIGKKDRERFIKRILDVNKSKKNFQGCPVCKIKYNHVESHLYNKHRLIRI